MTDEELHELWIDIAIEEAIREPWRDSDKRLERLGRIDLRALVRYGALQAAHQAIVRP